MSDSVRPHRRSPSGSTIAGILQARTLEWVTISFSTTENQNSWNYTHCSRVIPLWHNVCMQKQKCKNTCYSMMISCEVIFYCSFDLHFSDDWWHGASFHVSVCLLWRNCLFRSPAHFLNQVICFFNIELYVLFIYLLCILFIGHIISKYFFPFSR